VSKFQEDFVSDQGVTEKIEGRTFTLREPKGSEIDSIIDQCIIVSENDGAMTAKEDLEKRNKLLTLLVVADAPYEKDSKKFRQMTKEEKWDILDRLKSSIRVPLRRKILEYAGMVSDKKLEKK